MRTVAAMVLSLAVWAASSAQAAEPPAASSDAPAEAPSRAEQSRRVLHLSKTTMSPFCPGKTLSSCTSQAAHDWVDEMRGWVAAGDSDEEIRARLQARVPEFDLSDQPGGSWNWLLFVIPVVAATGVLVLIGRRVVARAPTPTATSPALAASDPERQDLEDLLDDELREHD